MNVADTPHGQVVGAAAYRLRVAADRPVATLEDPAGARLGRLVLLASVDAADGLDGTAAVSPPRLECTGDRVRVVVDVHGTRWRSKRVVLDCLEDELRLTVEVEGDGFLADVRLLGGWYPGDRRWGSGVQRTAFDARTLVSPNPEDPRRIAVTPNDPTTIGVVGGGGIGRGHWFFTPAPLCLAFSPNRAPDPATPPDGPWTSVSVEAALADLTFTSLLHEPLDGAFALRLAYEGQARVDGRWRSPDVVIRPGLATPYAGIERHRDALTARGWAPASSAMPPVAGGRSARPGWWSEPIFCGWGAQCAIAAADGSHPADHARQDVYDRFLDELAERNLDPGTIVIDDRWQWVYGRSEPDPRRWPDLPGWIAERHREGRRVLLWWKAWDAEGVPPELCVTTARGRTVSVDPSNPAYRQFLGAQIGRLVAPAPDGLGADGLKIDFTAQTPSGPGLRRHGPEWGIALLHRLLATIHDAAKAANPDAFVVAHAPNPAFADVADAVRLNDVLRLEDPDRTVPVLAQMRHRAAVARAACPDLLVETDDWGMPDRAAWREFLAAKAELGIPSLYYTTGLDLTGEALRDGDVAAIRDVWAAWRAAHGLPERRGERALEAVG